MSTCLLENICSTLFLLSHIIANRTNGLREINYGTKQKNGWPLMIEIRQTPIFEETSRSKIGS